MDNEKPTIVAENKADTLFVFLQPRQTPPDDRRQEITTIRALFRSSVVRFAMWRRGIDSR